MQDEEVVQIQLEEQKKELPTKPANVIHKIVTSSQNPFLRIYFEFIRGEISRTELLQCIDTMVISDHKFLWEYAFKERPSMPDGLKKLFEDVATKTKDPKKQFELTRSIETEAREGKFIGFYKACDSIESQNYSNRWWLKEMLDRNQDNLIWVNKIKEVILTHDRNYSGQ